MFGAFLSETIKNKSSYCGNGDAFVFTFHDGEDLEVFGSTGKNQKFQMTDDEFIIIGGASDQKNERAAIIISDRLTRGHSSPCPTFDNTILCGDSRDLNAEPEKFEYDNKAETIGGNFVVIEMEVWGFEADDRDRFY